MENYPEWAAMKRSIDSISKFQWWLARLALKWCGRDAVLWILREDDLRLDLDTRKKKLQSSNPIMSDARLGIVEKYLWISGDTHKKMEINRIEDLIKKYMTQTLHLDHEDVEVVPIPVKRTDDGDLVADGKDLDFMTTGDLLTEYFIFGEHLLAGYNPITKTLMLGFEGEDHLEVRRLRGEL